MKTAILSFLLVFHFLTVSNSLAQDWYFDKDSIGGKCSDTGTGTLTEPFCNPFNKFWNLMWNGAQAGDTIYLRGAKYTGSLFWLKSSVLTNGTEQSPITITPYNNETVIFDGGGTTPLLIKLYGTHNGLHFIGPFEATGYWGLLDGDAVATNHSGWKMDNWKIHNGSFGFYFRHFQNTTVKNINCYNLKGNPTHIDDHVMCIGFRGDPGIVSDNIYIENSVAHDINDGKGNDNGDADGFWTNEYVNNVYFKNITAYRCSEDGVDTKAKNVTMENIVSYHNGATGIKMWGTYQKDITTYNAKRILSFGNTETGVKCTGLTDTVTATIDNLTSWGNGQDNVKNTTGIDTSGGCNLTIRNSILGEAGGTSILFPVPRSGFQSQLHLINTNIFQPSGSIAINPLGCSILSGKYTVDQYTNGTFNSEMTTGVSCGGVYGTIRGSSVGASSYLPSLVDAPPAFQWASMAQNVITSDTLTLVTEASYPWPTPAVGQFVEINDDGVKRQIIKVGDATTRTIQFSPPVSTQVCGRATDCRGTRVTGWTYATSYTNDVSLTSESLAIDTGLFVNGVHCTLADDAGGKDLTDCIHWNGSSPDLGYLEFAGLQTDPPVGSTPPELPAISPKILDIKMKQ